MRFGLGSCEQELVKLVFQTGFQRADTFFEVEAEGDEVFDDVGMRWTGIWTVFLGGSAVVSEFVEDQEDEVLQVGKKEFVLCVEQGEAFVRRRKGLRGLDSVCR